MFTIRRSLDQSGHGGMSPMQSDVQPRSLQGPSRWPGTIGTLSIVIAALGIMCWGCSSGSSILQLVAPEFMAEMNQSYQETLTEDHLDSAGDQPVEDESAPAESGSGETDSTTTTQFQFSSNVQLPFSNIILDFIANVVSLGLSIWLLCGGIGLIRRSSWSVPTLITWSWIRILVAIGWFVVVYLSLEITLGIMMEQMQTNAAKEGHEIPISVEAMKAIAIVVIAIMGLFLIAWPVFLLCYLGRRHIRDEAASWGGVPMPSDDWDRA